MDVSELETVALVGLEPLLEGLDTTSEVCLPQYLVVESRDGEPLALFAMDDYEWRAILQLLSTDATSSTRKEDVLEAITRNVAGLDKDDALSRLGDAGFAATWVRHSAQVLKDDYLAKTGLWEQDRSPEVMNSRINIAGSLWQLDGHRTSIWRGSPRLFGDTRSVLMELLGYSDADVEAMSATGAIAVDTPE